MTEIVNKIRHHLQHQLPFAVYSKPGSNKITGLFQKDANVHFLTDYTAAGFVFAPFEGKNCVFIPVGVSDIVTATIYNNGFSLAEAKAPQIDDTAKKDFEALVSASVTAIRSGQFDKLVVSRKEAVALHTTDHPLLFRNILHAYPTAFRYCFYSPETGLWMGATPEQLLKADERTLHTVALAGTQLYKEGEEPVWPDKEQQEQHFVTDYILDGLKDHVSEINASRPYTFRAGNILHIKTDIQGQFKNNTALKDVITTLHPTPAVCGLPKADARQFLLENEGYNREYYSGFLGELNLDFATGEEGKTDLFVNLRCMKLEEDKANLFIGCGITKDSDPEKEFIETVNKSMTMRRVLDINI